MRGLSDRFRRTVSGEEGAETRTSARASLTAVSVVHSVPGRAPKRPRLAWERTWECRRSRHVDGRPVLGAVDARALIGRVVEL